MDLQQQSLDLQKQTAAIDIAGSVLGLQTQKDTLDVSIEETKGNIGIYENYLANFGSYETYQKNAAMAEGKTQFDALMSNFEAQAITAAATGRAGKGTSAQRVTNKQKQNVVDYVGKDMTLDANGGLFGQAYSQLLTDLNTEKTTAQTQLGIYQSSLTSLEESKTTLTEGIDYLTGILDNWGDPTTQETTTTKTTGKASPVNPLGAYNIGSEVGR